MRFAVYRTGQGPLFFSWKVVDNDDDDEEENEEEEEDDDHDDHDDCDVMVVVVMGMMIMMMIIAMMTHWPQFEFFLKKKVDVKMYSYHECR